MDLPILTFAGFWLLFFSYETGGTTGLIFPGLIGWVMLLVVLFRTTTILVRGRSFLPPYITRRRYLATWAVCAGVFLLAASTELFVGHWMPQTWKDAVVNALHIRRVYRNYGPAS